MGDFILDFRKKKNRITSEKADILRFYPDTRLEILEYEPFSLAITRPDDIDIWKSYISEDNRILVALSGRVYLEGSEIEKEKENGAPRNLVCRAIYRKYISRGIVGIRDINGNFSVFIYNSYEKIFYLINDRFGAFPCFTNESKTDRPVFGSHPDIVAALCEKTIDWDFTSIMEFLTSGHVSFPHTYYKAVKALDFGCIHTIDLKDTTAIRHSKRKYFDFTFKIDSRSSEWELAEKVAESLKHSVKIRTLQLYGQSAIGLSGGLDSRTILFSSDIRDKIWSFTFYDQDNKELASARSLAEIAGSKFFPMKRSFDYYGNEAEMGVRISGAMANIGTNHFLGFREEIKSLGIKNIITGLYCDSLFKALLMDTKRRSIARTEKISSFDYHSGGEEFYRVNSRYSQYVRKRWDSIFPDDMKRDESAIGKLLVESRRIFPLYYVSGVPDSIVPQKVMPLCLPVVDNGVLDVYLSIPPHLKINQSLFSKVVKLQCGENASNVINANTGARIDASPINLMFHRYTGALKRRLAKNSFATDGSWPNWNYYIKHSRKIKELWTGKNTLAQHVFEEILGEKLSGKLYSDHRNISSGLFLRIITLKIWFDQRQ